MMDTLSIGITGMTASNNMFYIIGEGSAKGVYLGPYLYNDAYDEWKRLSWLNVDDALYRLRIEPCGS